MLRVPLDLDTLAILRFRFGCWCARRDMFSAKNVICTECLTHLGHHRSSTNLVQASTKMPQQSDPKSVSETKTWPKRRAAPTLRQLLMQRHEWLYDRALAAAERHGYGFVTPAMARLFIQVARGPMSVSELARRLAISRQSLHETVSTACKCGLVELVSDPRNQRIRIVRFTKAGKRMSRTVVAVDLLLERDLTRRIGVTNVNALKRILAMPW